MPSTVKIVKRNLCLRILINTPKRERERPYFASIIIVSSILVNYRIDVYVLYRIHILIVVSIYNTIPFEDKPLDFFFFYDLSRREGGKINMELYNMKL